MSKDGAPVYARGYGMASLESGVAITLSSVFPAASISKQFTAMSILLLAQQGKLSIDDDVGKYIHEWSDHGARITIRHLLTHTSGLRDAFMLQGLAPARRDVGDPNEEILRILVRARGLNFAPGSEFQYNNGAYNVLGTIVKRVSGQSLRAFADANIFKPLGMTHTHFHDDSTIVVPGRVSGYHHEENSWQLATENAGIVGNAGLQTTVGDLLLWEQNFSDARVGDRPLIAAMETPAIPTGWSEGSYYGFGLEIAQHRGLRTIGHAGGDRGMTSYVVRYPERGFAAALLCNVDNVPVGKLTGELADIYLADASDTASARNDAPNQPQIPLVADQLSSKVGIYYDSLNGTAAHVFVRGGKLLIGEVVGDDEAAELSPVSDSRFVIPGTPIVLDFIPTTTGKALQLRLTGTAPKPVIWQRVQAPTVTPTALRAFAGSYTSAEVDGTYQLAVRDSALVIRVAGRSDIVLTRIAADAFAGPIVGVVKFLRAPDGKVNAFTIHSTGLRGVRFDRREQ